MTLDMMLKDKTSVGFTHQINFGSKQDYDHLTREDLEQFDVVIVLAGHSSVPSCNGDLYSPWFKQCN